MKCRLQKLCVFKALVAICLAVSAAIQTPLMARAPLESEFVAATVLGEDISYWIMRMERLPKSLGVFSVYANYPLEQDYSNIVETEVLKQLALRGLEKVVGCSECKAPQVSVQDDKLVIRKGVPDLEALKRIGSKMPVETFLTIDIYRTKLAIIAQVVLYQNPTGVVLAAERFRIPSLNISDASTHLLFLGSLGTPMVSSGTADTNFQMGFNVELLEEMGFGKGGLDLGLKMGGTSGMLIYMNPTLAFFGRFGSSALGYAFHLGAGYAFSGAIKGISLRGAYQLYLGSMTAFGAEGVYFIPLDTVTTPIMTGYIGFNIGFFFGR